MKTKINLRLFNISLLSTDRASSIAKLVLKGRKWKKSLIGVEGEKSKYTSTCTTENHYIKCNKIIFEKIVYTPF